MVTWLSPGLPLALFEHVRQHLERQLNRPVTLESRTKLSGPEIGSIDPFGNDQADMGFLCAPAAVPATMRAQAGFELLELAPLFHDERLQERPQCFCDLVVRADTPGRTLSDLKGLTFGTNDPSSLSGWLGLNAALKDIHTQPSQFFSRVVETGGHLNSLKQIHLGLIDVASIDSNVLRSQSISMQELRIVHSLGPWPAQPVVVRSSLQPELKRDIREALHTCGPWPEWHFVGFRHQGPEQLEQVPILASSHG